MSTEHPAPAKERARRKRGEQVRILISIVVAVLVTLFCVLNTDDVKVNWIVETTHTPLIVVIIVSLVIGTGFGWAAHYGRLRRKRSRARR